MRRGRRLLAIACLFLLVLPGLREAGQGAPAPRVHRAVLDNGLTVVVAENRAAEIVSLQVWVRAGSKDETPETSGAAHFLEHMLFKGTRRRKVGEIEREIESIGGRVNAATSRDFTYYWLVAASRFFDRVLDLQVDAVMNSTLDAQEVERERRVILEEMNRRDDNPPALLFDQMFAVLYTVHPYRHRVLGTRESVTGMGRDALAGFYRTYYVPSNMAVVVVGDVRAEETLARVRRAYQSFRGRPPARPPRPAEPPLRGVRRSVEDGDVRQAYLRLAFPGPGVRDPDTYALDVLATILGEGRASRLYRALRDPGIAHEVDAFYLTQEDSGPISVGAVVDPEQAARAEAVILEEIRRIRADGVTEDEVRRAKTLLEAQVARGTQTTDGMARVLGYYAVLADLEFVDTYMERMRRVTPDDVKRVAAKYLTPQDHVVAVLRPRGGR
ncbi:MAG: insulinase family protein [Armatimonadetes bacterium]|nr:insulinase family protein [Armatimonadota bacterium]